jgi:hypothetical protein
MKKKTSRVPDLYRVRFTDSEGITHYGTFDQYGKDAEKLAMAGIGAVDDAVFPIRHETTLDQLAAIPFKDWSDRRPDEYEEYVYKQFKKAVSLAEKNQSGEVQVNDLIALPVADGRAWYVVTKVNKKTVKVEWRGFCPDNYMDQRWGWGKTVPIEDCFPQRHFAFR